MAKKRRNLFIQIKDCSNEKHREDFNFCTATIESYGGTIGYEEEQIEEELKNLSKDPENSTEQETKDAKLVVKKVMVVCMFISRENKKRYGDLMTKLLNDYAKGFSNWPTNVDEVVQLVITYHIKKEPRGVQKMQAEMADSSVQEQELGQNQIKLKQPDKNNNDNEPTSETSWTTKSSRVPQQPAWMAEYQQNFANVEVESDEISKYISQDQFIDPIVHYIMTQHAIGMGL